MSGEVHHGIVSDISANGLFIQSSLKPDEGLDVEVTLREGGLGEIPLRGKVRRLRVSHRSAATVVSGGFAVEIASAPEAFFRLLVELGLG